MNIKNVAVFFVVAVGSSGCVAVWGSAHQITRADSDQFVVRYDPSLTSSVRTQALATAHCKEFGKVAVPKDSGMPGVLLGIIEETFACVPKES